MSKEYIEEKVEEFIKKFYIPDYVDSSLEEFYCTEDDLRFELKEALSEAIKKGQEIERERITEIAEGYIEEEEFKTFCAEFTPKEEA